MKRDKALSHIRVIDMARILAGPWCAQNLADLGAEVIKVERPGVGDDTRGWGPPWINDAKGQSTGSSSYYGSANRGKKSLTVDISTHEGQCIIRELVAISDVLIENYKAGDLKRYGLDYAALREINPRLVYCSITGYGQEGPNAHKPGYDFVFQAIGGLMSITGESDTLPGGGPQKVGIAIADVITGTKLSGQDRRRAGNRHGLARLHRCAWGQSGGQLLRQRQGSSPLRQCPRQYGSVSGIHCTRRGNRRRRGKRHPVAAILRRDRTA